MALFNTKKYKLHHVFFSTISCLLVVIAIFSCLLFKNANTLERLENTRYKLLTLGIELQESSDNLTRLSRLYVLTGDSLWEKKYWELLNIRNGKIPGPDGNTIAFHDSLLRLGVTTKEYDKLRMAEANSNSLVQLENIALQARKGIFADSLNNFTARTIADTPTARQILFSEKYATEREKVTRPIMEFRQMINERISRSISNEKSRNNLILISIIVTVLIISTVSFFAIYVLRGKVELQVVELQKSNELIRKSEERLTLQNRKLDAIVEMRNRDLNLKYLELIKVKSNLSSVFENTDVGHLLLDKDFTVVAVNKRFCKRSAKMYAGGSITVNTNYMSCVQPERRAVVRENFEHVLSHNEPLEYETEICVDEIPNYFLVSVVPVFSMGKVEGLCISVYDVTKRKLLELEREKVIKSLTVKNKDLEQFSFIVSHNLRGPLATISSLSSMLNIELSKDDFAYLIEGMQNAANKLEIVVRDLNNLLQARRQHSEARVPVNINDLLEEVLGSIPTLIRESHATVTADFNNVSLITTVRPYLSSIFLNMITNSIKYSKKEEPPVIKITGNRVNDEVYLCFEDNGVGIDLAKYGNKIFKLYERFNIDTEGYGMGLFMSKTQVEMLGGNIEIESCPEIGTKFLVRLPL